jgi:predicted DNA binding CopG/RHH family protein
VQQKKVGRPSKGPRVEVLLRVPSPMKDAAKREAAKRGLTVNDYVALLIEQATGIPYTNQEILPLAG